MGNQERNEKTAGWVVPSDAAVAVGRFRAEGPLGYRARSMPDAPLRATRAEAVADQMRYLASLGAAS